jgi:hypothetical protein
MSLSFIQKYKLQNNSNIYHVNGVDYSGKTAQFLLLVEEEKEEQFTKHLSDKIIDISLYGEVVYCCYGDDITESARLEILHKHGFSS